MAHRNSSVLYVGKSVTSLAQDVKTHFVAGRTGQSTVRRSLAGLLQAALDLRAEPRAGRRVPPVYPLGDFANFRLDEQGEVRLTQWMTAHLGLALWPSPVGAVGLGDIEVAVVEQGDPPLNITNVDTSRRDLRHKRQALAEQARAWAQAADA